MRNNALQERTLEEDEGREGKDEGGEGCLGGAFPRSVCVSLLPAADVR